MDKEDLKKAMMQAQEMQMGLVKVQEELQKQEVLGKAKNNMVEIVMTGQGETKAVKVNESLLSLDKPTVEASILEAINSATENAANLSQEMIAKVSKDFGMNP